MARFGRAQSYHPHIAHRALATALLTPYYISGSAVTNSTGTSVASGSWNLTGTITPAIGDLLVVKGASGSQNVTVTSVSGGGLTWTRTVPSLNTANNAYADIWTATATSASSFTLTVTYTNGGASTIIPSGFCCERFGNAGLALSPATATAQNTTAQVSLTSTLINSVVTWVNADWNGVATAPTYDAGSSATGTAFQSSGNACFYYAVESAGTVGSQTLGLTAPTGQKATLAALEILPASSAQTNWSGTATLSSTSTLSATATLLPALAAAALSSTSALSATGTLTAQAAAALSSTSALSATLAPMAVTLTLSATSSSSFTADPPLAPAAAVLSSTSAGPLASPSLLPAQASALFASTSAMVANAVGSTPPFFAPAGPVVVQTRVPQWSLLAFDTVTGRVGYELPYTTMSWTSKINDAGSLTATLQVESALAAIGYQTDGTEDPRTLLREFLTGPWRYSLAACYGSAVVWAGPYLPATADPTKPTVDIAGVEFGKLLDKRVMVNAAGSGALTDPSYDLVYAGTTLQGLIYKIVQSAVTGTNRSLPITCANVPGLVGLEDMTYRGYDLTTVWKALLDVANRDGGPDFRFDPYLYEGSDGQYIAYELRIGDPYFPGSGPLGPDAPTPWTWDETSATVAPTFDGTGVGTTFYVPGSGQDRAKLIGQASSTALPYIGWPALEVVDTQHSSVADAAQLTSFASADLASASAPTAYWQVKVPTEYGPPPGSYRVGDPVRLDIDRNIYIAPDSYTRRIVELDGDGTALLTMKLVEDAGV